MAHEQRQSTLIQVKSTPTDNSHIVKFVDVRNESSDGLFEEEVMAELMEWATKDENPADDCVAAADRLATNETTGENVRATLQEDEQHEEMNTGDNGGFIEVELKMAGTSDDRKDELKAEVMDCDNDGGEIKEENDKKKKEKKKEKKMSKKKNTLLESESQDNDREMKLPIKLAPIKKPEPVTGKDDSTKTDTARPKPAGCFGCVSTWLAKRKERRREKKRKAIEARKGKLFGKLAEYQHKQARGGVAFIVEVDNRPMNKSVLPPISRRPGPIRMASDQKLEKAEIKREEQINKKRDAARAHSRLVQTVNDRRSEKENIFKKSTLQKMQAKQDRVSSRLDYNRSQRAQSRCMSKLDILTARWEAAVAAPIVYREISPPLPLDEDVSSIDYYTGDDSDDVSINSWDYCRQ